MNKHRQIQSTYYINTNILISGCEIFTMEIAIHFESKENPLQVTKLNYYFITFYNLQVVSHTVKIYFTDNAWGSDHLVQHIPLT